MAFGNITGDGTISFSIPQGTAKDKSGNLCEPLLESPIINVDNTIPVINISVPSKATVKSGESTSYILTFNESNLNESSFSNSSVVLNKIGSVTGIMSITGGGNSRVVTIDNIVGIGTLSLSIGYGAISDKSGNVSLYIGPSSVVTVQTSSRLKLY
ncbi:hypothetical protein D3C76_1288710 [compost metagenome]